MRMPFGKFRGVDVTDLPDGYVDFLLGSIGNKLREPLRSEVCREWSRRFDPPASDIPFNEKVKVAALEVVNRGLRTLAHDRHPDRGGATEEMQTVNLAVEWLRRTVREAKCLPHR